MTEREKILEEAKQIKRSGSRTRIVQMDVKKYLYQVKHEIREIQLKRMELKQMERSLLPRGIRYDKDKVNATPHDPMEQAVRQIEAAGELEEELKQSIQRLDSRYRTAYQMIESLEESIQRQILHMYFLSGKEYSMDQIACLLPMSRASTYREYRKALDILNKKFETK